MKDIIADFEHDPDVAFAHTISADLDNCINMCAGVAVVFRNAFGKPLTSDCLSNHLAYQKTSNGSSVYSLITKLEYHRKPTVLDYDIAFRQLTEDFKK